MNQWAHKAIIILFIMELDIEFLVLSFSADDEKYKSTRESHCRNEMGCHPWVFSLPRCSLLSEKWAPLTSFAPFAGCFIALRRPSSPASNRLLGRDIQTVMRKKCLWEKCLWIIKRRRLLPKH